MLKKLIASLFSAKPKKPLPRINPFALPVPDDADPDLKIISGPRPVYPKKRGRTAEEFQEDIGEYHRKLQVKSAASFRLNKKRAVEIGSKSYIWRSSRDSDVCELCLSREGKLFPWDIEPAHGHAGVTDCCSGGYCRCYPEPVFD